MGQNLVTLSLVLTFTPALDIIDMAMTEQQDNSEEKGKSVQKMDISSVQHAITVREFLPFHTRQFFPCELP